MFKVDVTMIMFKIDVTRTMDTDTLAKSMGEVDG